MYTPLAVVEPELYGGCYNLDDSPSHHVTREPRVYIKGSLWSLWDYTCTCRWLKELLSPRLWDSNRQLYWCHFFSKNWTMEGRGLLMTLSWLKHATHTVNQLSHTRQGVNEEAWIEGNTHKVSNINLILLFIPLAFPYKIYTNTTRYRHLLNKGGALTGPNQPIVLQVLPLTHTSKWSRINIYWNIDLIFTKY
jgi:hypothetical protein